MLLQEDTKAPSSVAVVSTTEMASSSPGAHTVEDDAPAAVEDNVPAAEQDSEAAAGKVAVNAQAAEDPTAVAVQAQVRLPHLHVLLVLGPNTSPGCEAAQCAAAARFSHPCRLVLLTDTAGPGYPAWSNTLPRVEILGMPCTDWSLPMQLVRRHPGKQAAALIHIT